MLQMNARSLYGVLQDFYILTNLRVGLLDTEFREIMAYPEEYGGFCALVRKDPEGDARCHVSDKEACMKCSKTKAPICYCCHAGLTEVLVPISDKHGILAYVAFGQIVPKENYNATKAKIKKRYPQYADAVNSIPVKSDEEVRAAATILQAITAYVMTNRWITPGKTEFIEQLDEYIRAHMSRSITIEEICAVFCISRTRLYEVCMDYLGCALSEYIRRQRIIHAQAMLRMPEKSVSDIACEVGFNDYNHFSRIFKKQTGCSAREYRARMMEQNVQENTDDER